MARTTQELLEQLYRLLPAHFVSAEPLLAGLAAALRVGEVSAETLRALGYLEGAVGSWLTLHGRGLGVLRATGESDASLRTRIRQVEDLVTPAAITAIVDELVAPDSSELVEWWDEPYLDVEGEGGLWLEGALLSGGPQSFFVVIPDQGGDFTWGGHVDADMWLGSEFVGAAIEPPVYSAIINAVERARAAGVFWRLVLQGQPAPLPKVQAFVLTASQSWLATRALPSDTLAETRGARTHVAWVRPTALAGFAETGLVSTLLNSASPKRGQSLQFVATGPFVSELGALHYDTGGTKRQLKVTPSSLSGWHAFAASWVDTGAGGTIQRVCYDSSDNRSSEALTSDHEDGVVELVEFGNQDGGSEIGALIVRPLVVSADWLVGTELDVYVADRGQGLDPLLASSAVLCAPVPDGDDGDIVRIYAVNRAGLEVSGVDVVGLPARWAGVDEGFATSDDHYLTGAWPEPGSVGAGDVPNDFDGGGVPQAGVVGNPMNNPSGNGITGVSDADYLTAPAILLGVGEVLTYLVRVRRGEPTRENYLLSRVSTSAAGIEIRVSDSPLPFTINASLFAGGGGGAGGRTVSELIASIGDDLWIVATVREDTTTPELGGVSIRTFDASGTLVTGPTTFQGTKPVGPISFGSVMLGRDTTPGADASEIEGDGLQWAVVRHSAGLSDADVSAFINTGVPGSGAGVWWYRRRTSPSDGATIIVALEGDDAPASDTVFFDRASGGGGGVRLAVAGGSDGIELAYELYDGAGSSTASGTLAVPGASLGDRLFYALTISSGGTEGDVYAFAADGTELASTGWSASGAVAINDDWVAGRATIGSGDPAYDEDAGVTFLYAIIMEELVSSEIEAYIRNEFTAVEADLEIAGLDVVGVRDAADKVRGDGRRRLIGPFSGRGVVASGSITIEDVGPAIRPGWT